MNVVEKIAADGNSVAADNGVPPKVTHHMITVTIQPGQRVDDNRK